MVARKGTAGVVQPESEAATVTETASSVPAIATPEKDVGGIGHGMVLPLIVLMFIQICTASDNCLLGISTQSIMTTLSASINDVQMATMAYSLVAGAFMIAGGMLGMIIGWRKNIRIGLVLAITGEVTLALTNNIVVFIWVGRVLVGLGASLITPSVFGLVPAYWKGHARLLAFGFIAGATGFATLAPVPFGMVLDAIGLRPAFLVLVVMFALAILGTFALPNPGHPDKSMKMDILGVVLAAAGLFLVLTGASRISSWGVLSPLTNCPFTLFGISPALPMIVLGIAILVVFMKMEKRIEASKGYALLPRAFIRTKQVRAGLLAVAVPYFYMGAQSILMTPYIQLVGGLTATQTGMLSIISGVPMLLLSMFIPKLLPMASPRRVVQVGYVVTASAAFMMAASLLPHGISSLMFAAVFLAGTGMGIVNSQANNAVASAVGPRDAQQSGGMQGTMRNLGTAFGAAIMGTMLLLTLNAGFHMTLDSSDAIDSGTRTSLEQTTVSFMSDEGFMSLLEGSGVDADATDELVEYDASARMVAARISLVTVGAVLLLCLLSTGGVAKESPARRAKREAQSAGA